MKFTLVIEDVGNDAVNISMEFDPPLKEMKETACAIIVHDIMEVIRDFKTMETVGDNHDTRH